MLGHAMQHTLAGCQQPPVSAASAACDDTVWLAGTCRLQSNAAGPKHAKVWGEAAPGASVSLCIGSATPCSKSAADADGAFAIELATPPGGPHTLTLSAGSATLSATGVYFGNVLVCSGQSNLEFTMDQIDNSKTEEAAADAAGLKGRIKLFSAPDNKAFAGNSSNPAAASPQKYPPEDCNSAGPGACGGGAPTAVTWYEANSTTVDRFSALCYLVAREMVRSQPDDNTTWGLIQSAKGGTPVEGWLAGDQLHRFTKCGMDPSCPIFSQVRKQTHFYTKNHRFTETGSGQTQRKLTKRPLLRRARHPPTRANLRRNGRGRRCCTIR
jgi:hypothetical protein